MEGKATNRHVFLRMVREVEMSSDWFESVFIVNFNIPKVFAETITQSAARFADVYTKYKLMSKYYHGDSVILFSKLSNRARSDWRFTCSHLVTETWL